MQDTILRLCASTALVGVLSLPANAQQIINLEELTFSANLAETEIRRSGASVSVINREELEASGTNRLQDILTRLPGVSVISEGGVGASANIRLRGADKRYLAIYVDGVRIDDPTGTEVSTDIGKLSLFDVDRIELLRGSQSALYGGSAVAGVINITTRNAEQDGVSQSAFVEGGSYGTAAAGYSLTYRDERWEAALSFAHQTTQGFTAYEGIPGTPSYEPNAEADGHQTTRVSFSSKYQASDILTLGVSGFYQLAKTQYDPWDSVTFQTLPNADAEYRQREAGLRFSAEFDLDATQHTLAASGFVIRRNAEELGVPQGQFDGRRLGLEYTGLAQINTGLSLGWGADLTFETVKTQSIPAGETTRNLGVYAQILWAPTEALDLSASIRADNHSSFGTFYTGRLSGAYQASDAVTIRGAIARGFRAPALDELFGDYPDRQFIGNPNLSPERSDSAEIGIDIRSASGAELSATAFWLNTQNRIGYERCPLNDPFDWSSGCLPGTINSMTNYAGTSRRSGLELSAKLPVTDTLTMSGNYTYTHARNPDNTRMARVPRHTANLALTGQFDDMTSFSISAQHVADRPDDWGMEWKDYTVANAMVRYRVNDQADLYLRIDNIFDRNYQINPGYKTSGRAFYLGVASRF